MRDEKADTSQASEGPLIPPERLKEILEAHRKWLESEGREGGMADLPYANLKGADLRGANLERANFLGANLFDASLDLANLQGATLREANLQKASLLRANLREADLQDADLIGATGLLGGELAGANVSGAKLPPDIHRLEGLTTVQEASRNAQTVFFSMLLACVYAWLTIATTTDARLLTNSASSPLPIIGTAIPIVEFYWAAPLVLLGTYLYFHLYLQRLWERLAKLPAVFPDGSAVDEKAYPWLLIGLVRAHFARLRQNRPPLSRLQRMISILLAWWVLPATMVLFWGRYLARHDWMGTAFHIALLVISIGFGIMFYRLATATLGGERMRPFVWTKALRDRRFTAPLCIGIIFSLMSVAAIYGPPYLVARADLFQADVSTKPANWTGQKKEEIALVKGARLEGKSLRYVKAFKAFLVNADLRFADLRGADLWGADLRASELRRADLRGANLWGADLKEAKMIEADLRGAYLGAADLQGADLALANLHSADLELADLQGAELTGAKLQGANLLGARGLVASQVKAAQHWELAFYSSDLLKELGLPTEHNIRVRQTLADAEGERQPAAANP